MSQARFCPWELPPGQQSSEPSGYQVPRSYYSSPQPDPNWPPPVEKIILRQCSACDQYIQPGEKSIELAYGIEGRSEQSGMPITIAPQRAELEVFAVHKKCILEHVSERCPDEWDDFIWEAIEERATEMFNEWQQDPDGELDRRMADERS